MNAIKVVIVTYNSALHIQSCLDALQLSSARYSFDVTVVDNGSTDGTLELLRDNYPSVKVIENSNLGYAHGNNLGIREALESGLEFLAILILNPDSTLRPRSIDRLADALFSSPEVGAVSPHIALTDGRACDRLRSLVGRPLNESPLAGRDAVISDRLHGCCMLVKPEVFRDAGYIDEDYFLYWEEVDFGLKAIAAGFKLLLCYDVLVEHGSGEERPHRVYYMWRNQFLFARENYRSFGKMAFLARRMLASTRDLAGFMAKRRFDLARVAIKGFAAGLRGETGCASDFHGAPSNSDGENR